MSGETNEGDAVIVSEDLTKTRRDILASCLRVLMGTTTAALPLVPFVQPTVPAWIVVFGFLPFYLVYGGSIVLLRAGKGRQAAWLTVLGTMILQLIANAFNSGIEGQALVSCLNLVLIAGFTLGNSAVVLTTLSAVTGVVVYTWFNSRNLMPPPFAEPTVLSSLMTTCLTIAGTGGIVFVVLKHVRAALLRERQALVQVRQVERMDAIGRFSSGLAHDFNNLLATILTGLDQAEKKQENALEFNSAMARVRQATQRAARLTKKMMTLDSAAGATTIEMDLGACLEQLDCALQEAVAPTVSLLRSQVAPGVGVLADPVELEQIILNLVSNANDAVSDGGTIWIEVDASPSVEPGFVALYIRDDGVGMSEETCRRAFEPFFTTRRSTGGSGLGLSGAYALARRQGAKLTLESTPGEGTSFCLLLQAADLENVAQRSSAKGSSADGSSAKGSSAEARLGSAIGNKDAAEVISEKRPLLREGRAALAPAQLHGVAKEEAVDEEQRRGRILLVDDNVALRCTLAAMLKDIGHEVVEAESPRDAQCMFYNQGPFDALMTDITMPQMSGYELLALLREARPSLPAILMTGFEQKTAEAQQVLQPYARLEKPFGEAALAAALERILATDAGAPTLTATREAV